MELTPIITPADWTSEKDFEYYEDRWGVPDNYFDEVLERVSNSYEELIEVVDSALKYFEGKDHRLVPVHPGTLTLLEKVNRLSSITDGRSDDYKYKDRFAGHLHACIWVENERGRVMQSHYLGEEKTWLYPLIELSDALACAAIELEEAMRVEHKDFREREDS